ncbi:hypothetical protein ACFLU4_00500 [Chloroflexota bacterium]
MKVLKGFAVAILSLILFLLLPIFATVFMANQTILNPDFVVTELNRLEIGPLAGEIVSEQLPPDYELLADVISETIAEVEPWVKEQAGAAIHASYDYLMGRSQRLELVISLEQVKVVLKEKLRAAAVESLPPVLEGLPPSQIELYLEETIQGIDAQIPSRFEFSQDDLDSFLGRGTLEQVREYLGYYRIGYMGLIGLILLLILGIVLVYREVRSPTRALGITFLLSGGLLYAGIFFARDFVGTEITGLIPVDISGQLNEWLLGLWANLLSPPRMLSIGLLAGGVALLIVSFVYRPRLED